MTQESGERRHSCPNCGSEAVRRSLRSGIVENIFYRMIGLRPYGCQACGERFFDRRGAPGRKENTRD
jgi:predicted RNA-binding Zn-ribbon protein involved in translation (DUF1610 family)